MDIPMNVTSTRARRPLAALGKLTVVALIGLGLCLAYLQVAIIGMIIPPLAVFVALSLVIAGVVAIGWRWAPALGALWCGFIVAGNAQDLSYNLAHPASTHEFGFALILLAVALVGIVAGIAAMVQNYRSAERRAPRLMPFALTALVALCLGAILVAAIPQAGASAGVSDAALAGLPALTAANSAFTQPEIHAKVGEMVALRLENNDSEAHSFDIDELNVHAAMPGGQRALALFKPTQAGTYSFYCGIPAHREFMTGKLIIES
ncbi:MAG: cupredoxin domain-containing protein [Roseiflexaceae bacterium]